MTVSQRAHVRGDVFFHGTGASFSCAAPPTRVEKRWGGRLRRMLRRLDDHVGRVT